MKLEGLKINFLGDSITEGAGVSGIQPNVPEVKAAFAPDGLHPNDAGHVIIKDRLKGFLESL